MNTKKLLIIICILANQFINSANAQAPQSFNYQAVARDGTGAVLSNQAVSFRISLLQGSGTGTNVYSETHPVTTNQFGLVNFAIGGGTLVSGSFANINWAQGPYFVQVELDATGGSTYVIMNTTQLLSVPYALYAEKSGNPTLQAGSGITIQNDSIINTAQNQQINLSGTGQTNITGTYPNYVVNTPNIQAGNGISVTGQTITNTAPDQTVSINGTGQTNVTGTYPNFTVNTPPYIAGNGIAINNDTIINTAPGIIIAGYGISITGAGTVGDPYVVSQSGCGLSIGDTAQGGIIFYLDGTGCHGLVAKLSDEIGLYEWTSTLLGNIYSYSTGIYGGAQNTKKILHRAPLTGNTCPAATQASLPFGGYNDWYLPNREELDMMYINLYLQGLGGFSNGPGADNYWSSVESLESGGGSAYSEDFSGGFLIYNGKTTALHVRAIRAF